MTWQYIFELFVWATSQNNKQTFAVYKDVSLHVYELVEFCEEEGLTVPTYTTASGNPSIELVVATAID